MMEQISRADLAAFKDGRSAMANAIIDESRLRVDGERRRGRGAGVNPSGRFEVFSRQVFDDGWSSLDDLPANNSEVMAEITPSIN